MALTKVTNSMIQGAPANVLDFGSDIQAAVDAVYAAGGGEILLPPGTYTITTTIDCYPASAVRLIFRGAGQAVTTITTTQDITVFSHAESFECHDMSITQLGTAKTGSAFSTTTTNQSAYCRYTNLNVTGFKYGIWWRYSLWNTVANVRFKNCGVGVRMSRNALPNDQTNPYSTGAWNITGGYFHNQNTFSNVLCDGGEVGIWGTPNGCEFSNITCQNQADVTGATNTVAPVNTPGTGLWFESGIATSVFGSQANHVSTAYFEGTRQPMVFNYANLTLTSYYVQGGAIGNKFPQVIKITGGSIRGESCSATGSDYFDYRIVADTATLYGEIGAGSTAVSPALIGAYSLTSTNWYRYAGALGVNTTISVPGVSTTTVATAEDYTNYSVEVGGLSNGVTVKIASFQVFRWNTGATTIIIGHPSNPADITCTNSGASIQINTTSAVSYVLYVNAITNSRMGQFV